jgi:hypothetical protein
VCPDFASSSGEEIGLGLEEKLAPPAIARHLGIGRASVYRALATTKNSV